MVFRTHVSMGGDGRRDVTKPAAADETGNLTLYQS